MAEVSIYPYGIQVSKLLSAIKTLELPVTIVDNIADADVLLTIKRHMKNKVKINQIKQGHHVQVHVLGSHDLPDIFGFFKSYYKLTDTQDQLELEAVTEARWACQKAISEKRNIDLAPQLSYIRRVQHQTVKRYGLVSISIGEEPNRRLRIYRKESAHHEHELMNNLGDKQ